VRSSLSFSRFITLSFVIAIFVISLGTLEVFSADSSSAGPADEYSSKKDAVNPLKPADTSSPRDTLRSFLRDIDIAIVEKHRSWELQTPVVDQAFIRAASTLNFRTTPDGTSNLIISQRTLLLKEILDRVEFPPTEEIPGDEEVARKYLKKWTIPGTSITIERVETGPRAGEYLFSAWTVQRLHRFYRMLREHPYKPDATPDFYEEWLSSESGIVHLEGSIRNRLKPINTSSPRFTLEGFLQSVNNVYALAMEADAALKVSPPTITDNEAREIRARALNLIRHAVDTLDLSKVPRALREDVGFESVLQMKEIFDRMLLPSIESVPDREMVETERERLTKTARGEKRPVRWRYPSTTIEIVEIMEGERQGQFLFSARTVRNLDQLYKKIRDLPYRGDYAPNALEYISPGTSEGFYDYYISTPGYLIPRATFLGRLVESLPNWLKIEIGSQIVWQWVLMVLLLISGALLLVAFHGGLLRRSVELTAVTHHWRRVIFIVVALGVFRSLFLVLNDTINLTGSVLSLISMSLTTIWWFFLAAGVFFLSALASEGIIASPKIDPEGIQASFIRAVFGIFGLFTWAAIFMYGLSNVGISLLPLLTAAGIGGLAIALAARPTLENIIGSFAIFMDKPYQVGQRVKVMGQDGNVESIGLRSTKIRLLTGHLSSIPNEKMAALEIENIGRRPYIRRHFNVNITYDTPPEKITRAVEILREILAVPGTPDTESTDSAHPNEAVNQPEFPPRVFFNELNSDSLNILVIYWYHPPIYWDYLEHANWINIQIMERFKAEGISFAFPTQTLHLAGDEKHPLTVDQRAVSSDVENEDRRE